MSKPGNQKKPRFDNLVETVCKRIPLGKTFHRLYFEHQTLNRFFKYGLWIAIQFWFLRAPFVMLLVSLLPDRIVFVPGYLLADFIAGSLLAVGGFVLSEWWIWRTGKNEVS